MTSRPDALDALVADILARHDYRFTVATDDAGRHAAYRLRYLATVEEGWAAGPATPDGLERDEYDDRAVHVLGWQGDIPIATGRIVLPPGPLPTEQICQIVVEPRGRVADVGRMAVARGHQSPAHPVFVALLARLYLEVRQRGYEFACGLMSPGARALMRVLGARIEVLGDDRPHRGERRAPVRFAVTDNTVPLAARWG